ncbi:MAG: DUF2339 domain-containing protein [Flavobacteriales bacterium]|nr:DUF2339 domain-containing protein [Flavobacteriales bacterium]
MEGIIILILLAILAVPVILLIWVKVSTGNSIQEVANKLNSLNIKIDQIGVEKKKKKTPEEDPVIVNENLLTLMETLPVEEKIEEPKESKAEIIKEEVKPQVVQSVIPEKKIETKVVIPQKPKQAAFVKPKKEKKRDIEKFIGENLINKIGIGILVLGIAYFVRYAIDKEWISEIGRVAIGILSGGILTLFAHRMRKTFTAFSSVLVGGAMAVFYYTISIGFHEYELFSQPVAFSLMVLITGFSVLLSISYDRKELAILGLIGAFSTPLMVSNGGGNYQVLFSYLAIVNIGMLVLSYFKKWNVVNILSFAFTVLMYGGWFVSKVINVEAAPYQGAFLFAGLFYVIFFFMHIVNNVKEKRKFKGYEFGLMLSTTALFYAAGMSILYLSGYKQFQGLFTIGLGVFNLLFAFPLFKRQNVDKSLIFLLIGIVLTFVSLAAPVQLSGNYITLFWTTEMVLLLWLGQKSNIKFMKFSSLVILCLMLVSLVMDWQQIYFDYGTSSLAIIINKGFITTVFSIVGVSAYTRLLNNEKGESFLPSVGVQFMKNMSAIIVGTLIYLIGVIEIGFQIGDRLNYSELSVISIMGYTYLFLLGLWLYAKRTSNLFLDKGITFVSIIVLVSYPLFYGVEGAIRADYLLGEVSFLNFLIQYVNLAMIVLIAIQLLKNVREWYGLRTDIGKVIVCGLSFFGLVVASMQLNHQALLIFFDQFQENAHFINKQTVKIGYPIIWGISSFVLMLVGMKYKYRTLRIISLSIFSVILVKLFLFDIKGASEGGKIVAFILLGVLLLVISFMYQKLKNLLLDNGSDKK